MKTAADRPWSTCLPQYDISYGRIHHANIVATSDMAGIDLDDIRPHLLFRDCSILYLWTSRLLKDKGYLVYYLSSLGDIMRLPTSYPPNPSRLLWHMICSLWYCHLWQHILSLWLTHYLPHWGSYYHFHALHYLDPALVSTTRDFIFMMVIFSRCIFCQT